MTETNTTRTPALSADDWRQIAVWLTAADIDGIEIGTPGHTLRMTRDGGSYQVQAMAVSDGASRSVPVKSIVVTAPCAGVLLDRHPLATEPWARSGDPVTAGDLIGLLQMGLVLAPVIAPVTGMVMRVLLPAGSTVGYGAGLFELVEGSP